MTRADTRADTATFADFYRSTFHRVASQLYAYLGDHAEAQDLTQEAFCRALDRWGRVSTYENPDGWVRQVAWNLATSRLRHLQVVKRFMALQRQEHVQAPGPERIDLTRALAALPPNHRLAVVLHHMGRLSTSEIAAQQGVAEGTVRSWLSRGRVQLAEQLVDWDQATVAPPEGGIEAAVVKVRRRRTAKRATLAAALALLIAVPLTILVLGQRSAPPVIGPTPPPSPSVSPTPLSDVGNRRIVFPDDFKGRLQDVRWVDKDHGWLWQSTCDNGTNATGCQKLAITADRGKTWRRIGLPRTPDGANVTLDAVNATTATLRVTEWQKDKPSNYWHTTDGGATFKSYPVETPPLETVISLHGHYQMMCPGATGMEDAAWGARCDRLELVKVGSGPVAKQPPVRGITTRVIEGGDGRLWLIADEGGPRLRVSQDNATTWNPVPWPSGVRGGLALSRDGKQAWIVAAGDPGGIALWELTGSQWVKRFTSPNGEMPPVLLGSAWLVSRGGVPGYFHNGEYTSIPDLPVPRAGYLLDDGTVVLRSAVGAYTFGVGSGTLYRWETLTQ